MKAVWSRLSVVKIVAIPGRHGDAVLAHDGNIVGRILAEDAAGRVAGTDRHHVVAADDRVDLGAMQQENGFLEAGIVAVVAKGLRFQ